MSSLRLEDGQAAAELIVVTVLATVVAIALAQASIAGYALWSAGLAARAGARAAHVGGDARAAAISALPRFLARGARIGTEDGVKVQLQAPSLLPGLPKLAVGGRASLTLSSD